MLLAIPKLFCHLLFWLIIFALFGSASMRDIGRGYVMTCWDWNDKRQCYTVEAPKPVRYLLDRRPNPKAPLLDIKFHHA